MLLLLSLYFVDKIRVSMTRKFTNLYGKQFFKELRHFEQEKDAGS